MSTYAIGDVQGCLNALKSLLLTIQFNADKDCLWFTGDLVNRGPQSLETLRFIRSIPNVVTVLGNHDFYLLALAGGVCAQTKKHTLTEVLSAPDVGVLTEWLRHQPIIHHDAQLNYTMVHAGWMPEWTLQEAKDHAHEVTHMLQGPHYLAFLGQIYGDQPDQWHHELQGWERLRLIVNAFTRIRYCDQEGRLDFQYKGPITGKAAWQIPWFDMPNRASRNERIIFGHWAALRGQVNRPNLYAMDGGCVWGHQLMALRLEDQQRFWVSCGQ